MRAELWRRAAALLAEGDEVGDAERAAWLDRVAKGDAELRTAVETLLEADRAARRESFLEPDPATPGRRAPVLPERIGRYRIREWLGGGGFGEVFRAFDPGLKRGVAIKVSRGADDADRERFAREAELVARLEHPNVSRVYDFGVDDGAPFLVQELLPGEDLAAAAGREPRPTLAERVAWLLDAARGLACAHRAGIAHRDVKPGNLRVLPDGSLKVLDFGIAVARESAAVESAGTLAYMAPERLRGEGDPVRGDVYGWGAVAWELLSGRQRSAARSPLAQLYVAAHQDWPRLRREDCPPALGAVVARALSRDAERRQADAAELVKELEPLVAALGGARRSRRWIGVAGLGVAALAAAIVWEVVGRRPEMVAPSLPPPAATPGLLQIDARPWARVERVVDGDGVLIDLDGETVTPVALSVPAGQYTVRLRGSSGAAECTTRVPAGGSGRCAALLEPVDVDGFLREVTR